MKKITRYSISVLLVLCMIMVTTTVVFAGSGPTASTSTIVWQDPTGTTDSALIPYTAEVLDTWKIPGTEINGKQLTVPLGYAVNEIQFGGKALKVSDLASGKSINVCFDFPLYRYDWSGEIYMWDGTEWMKQVTTITTDNPTQACTRVYANGYYALLIQFWGTPEPPLVTPAVG
jgi:hypothetical protein